MTVAAYQDEPRREPEARLVLVSTNADDRTAGALVTCATCGAAGRTPEPPEPGQVILCPVCTLRLLSGGSRS